MTDNDAARPAWAVELITQVAILNEKLPTHIEWVERNIKDHETRLRRVETRMWLAVGGFGLIAAAQPFLVALIH